MLHKHPKEKLSTNNTFSYSLIFNTSNNHHFYKSRAFLAGKGVVSATDLRRDNAFCLSTLPTSKWFHQVRFYRQEKLKRCVWKKHCQTGFVPCLLRDCTITLKPAQEESSELEHWQMNSGPHTNLQEETPEFHSWYLKPCRETLVN